MTNANVMKERTLKVLPDFLKRHSRDKLALKAGVGREVVDNLLEGNDINEPLLKAIFKVVNTGDIMEDIFKTADLAKGRQAADKATKYKLCIALTGDTGTGKSMLAQLLATRDNVFKYTIEESTSPKVFLRGMLESLRIYGWGTEHEMLHAAAKYINSLESPLIVIDESGKMSRRMVLLMHDLRNLTGAKCGLMFLGMPYFKNNLINGRDAGVKGYAEFFRRIQLWDTLEGLTKPEINHILQRHGVEDRELQMKCRNMKRIADLLNEILLHKALHDQL